MARHLLMGAVIADQAIGKTLEVTKTRAMSVQFATTERERRAIYRLRYDIYVGEMGFFKDSADHEKGIFVDEHDAGGRLLHLR